MSIICLKKIFNLIYLLADHPLSPRLQETHLDTSPMTTPPHTPQAPPSDDSNQSISSNNTIPQNVSTRSNNSGVTVCNESTAGSSNMSVTFSSAVEEHNNKLNSVAAGVRRTRSASTGSRTRTTSISADDLNEVKVCIYFYFLFLIVIFFELKNIQQNFENNFQFKGN